MIVLAMTAALVTLFYKFRDWTSRLFWSVFLIVGTTLSPHSMKMWIPVFVFICLFFLPRSNLPFWKNPGWRPRNRNRNRRRKEP